MKKLLKTTKVLFFMIVMFAYLISGIITPTSAKTAEVTVQDFTKTIMNAKAENMRGQIYNYLFMPAYSTNDSTGISEKEMDIEKSELLATAKELASMSEESLRAKLKTLISKDVEILISTPNISITDEYLLFTKKYVSANQYTRLKGKVKNSAIIESATTIETMQTKNRTNKHTFKGTYGTSRRFVSCKFMSTVTWKTQNSKIVSIKSTTPAVETPFFIEATSAKRDKTYRSSSKKTGFVQKGWGFVDILLAQQGLTGYYVLDIKVYGNNKYKHRFSTIPPNAWGFYNWGNF